MELNIFAEAHHIYRRTVKQFMEKEKVIVAKYMGL